MSDDRVIEPLRRYGEWIEEETGLNLQKPPGRALPGGSRSNDPIEVAAVATPRRRRWLSGRRSTAVFAAAAAVVLFVAVGAVAVFGPAGEPAALFTRVDDPQGPLFVLPGEDAGYDLSGGVVSSTMPTSKLVGRVWIGTPDTSGTVFSDIVQVCVSTAPTECSSTSDPFAVRDRVEVDGRFYSVTTSSDASVVVVSDQRDLLHVSARARDSYTPTELATLLNDVRLDDNGAPSVDIEAPAVVFATQNGTEESEPDLLHLTRFDVNATGDGDGIVVWTSTGTSIPTSPTFLPGGVELDSVTLNNTLIGGVVATEVVYTMPNQEPTRAVMWQASPTRVIAASSTTASFDELVNLARTLTETTETTWRARLDSHQTNTDQQPHDTD